MPPKKGPSHTGDSEPTEVDIAARMEEIAGKLQTSNKETMVYLNLMNSKLEEVLSCYRPKFYNRRYRRYMQEKQKYHWSKITRCVILVWNKTALVLEI